MAEKTRSVSITGSGSGGVGTGTSTIIIGPMSSSPSSLICGPTTAGVGSLPLLHGASGGSIGPNSNNDSESELGGHELCTSMGGGGGGLDTSSIMNSSQISTASNESSTVPITKSNIHYTHNIGGGSCRFPKLEECAHFHYERVQLGSLTVRLSDEKSDQFTNTSIASQSLSGDVVTLISQSQSQAQYFQIGANNPTSSTPKNFFNPSMCWFIMRVTSSRTDSFLIKRSFDNLRMLDEMLHRCVYDRKISGLKELSQLEFKSEEELEYAVAKYLERFSKIASDSLTCGTILTWFQLDNKGRRLPLADSDTMKSINTPAVGAAYGVRRYIAQACDEISIEVGDMISVIDMPSPAESVWWRGKKSHQQKSHYEVGFFPQSCVATIGDKVPRHFPLPAPLVGQLDVSPTKPVLRKHGKLIAFFRSFILSRPSRRRLKQTGIYRERVFSCDLSEHLLNSGQEIPMVLKCCAEFIEENGIVDGIYRLSGITSNIQKLRRAFDEERIPDLSQPDIRQDIHAVSSLLKMYFRELPNPLCTYQLYDNFVEAIQTKSDSNERLRLMKETVLKLPPPHYRTLKYLAMHLSKISRHSASTGMTDKNLAIVWAPNLLRSPALESGGVAALRGVGVQAVVTEYLIKNCNLIFDPNDDYNRSNDQRMDSLTDCESLLVEQREHDQSLSLIERPKSLSAGGAKLISLEEAQERHSRLEGNDPNKSIPINTPSTNIGSYIEVGGGPSSLPDKYHTVLPVPRSWQKRKTHSWKSLFSRNPRNSNSNNDIKALNVSSPVQKELEVSLPYSEGEVNKIEKSHDVEVSSQQQKPKSINLFDGKTSMDVCIRSNSIDSLRTAGHSRSVSHDSYFDLLQSPLRGVATCPSRELSELGLNFDREEPEMRIFSESESLVSSPKVGKENVPPSRRILRARPEEYSSTTNVINPSPKKQPRLNILSPSDPPAWNHPVVCEGSHNDESCCKRYKLEDQLSDIQFIDCSTPEHTLTNPNTVYTSVQIHNPPASLSKSSSYSEDAQTIKRSTNSGLDGVFDNQNKIIDNSTNAATRYSYPVVHFSMAGKRKENDAALKERFSYPGSANSSKYICRMPLPTPEDIKMNNEDGRKNEVNRQRNIFSQKSDLMKPKDRYSYCETISISAAGSSADVIHPSSNFLLRSNSADLVKTSKSLCGEIERSKLSVLTPSSPVQSPRYSLLVGETSSENSSALNTPIYDEMDINSHPEICNSTTNKRRDGGKRGIDGEYVLENYYEYENEPEQHCSFRNFDTKENGCILSEDSCNNITSQLSHNINDKRDISAIKRELSLDLEGGGSKMSVDLTDISLSSNNKQINIPSSPNNSNFTQHTSDNTSQSITPSEFGYQHLNRQSNAVSLENSPKFEGYDNLEQAFLNYDKTISTNPSPSKGKIISPIKATISITYNLKSPLQHKCPTVSVIKPTNGDESDSELASATTPQQQNKNDKVNEKTLLETTFDENMVYEQVKFFRSSVSEVNQILNNGNNGDFPTTPVASDFKSKSNSDYYHHQLQQQHIVPDINCDKEVNSNLIMESEKDQEVDSSEYGLSDDILMDDNIDSLETDENYSLYENVEMRKPPSVYENIEINAMKMCKPYENQQQQQQQQHQKNGQNNQISSHETAKTTPINNKGKESHKSASNFSVKQLATKFETSPVEQTQPFDFNQTRNSKKFDFIVTNRDAPCYVRAKNHSKQLNKSAQITRSLDENAFVREFGQKRLEDITKSAQQIEKIENDIRRKSLDFVKPKCLNPPKHLPTLESNDSIELCKIAGNIVVGDNLTVIGTTTATTASKLKLDLEKVNENSSQKSEIKITPTTENRISLIQNNVDIKSLEDDRSNVTAINLPNSKVLSGVKLDRERIERIKEERRHQLSEKYRTESFKSKSKTELREFPKDEKIQSESLRIKSKSRGDVRNFLKEVDNFKGSDIMQFSNRIRRISDEKNQNNCEATTPTRTTTTTTVSNNTTEMLTSSSSSSSSPKIGSGLFDRKSIDFPRERDVSSTDITRSNVRNTISSTREKISPQFSIRDVTAMFESKLQNP